MTSKDTTGEQLVASMRRAKEGAAKRSDGAPAPAGRAKPRRRAANKTNKPVAGRARADPVNTPSGSYQVGRRVWPD